MAAALEPPHGAGPGLWEGEVPPTLTCSKPCRPSQQSFQGQEGLSSFLEPHAGLSTACTRMHSRTLTRSHTLIHTARPCTLTPPLPPLQGPAWGGLGGAEGGCAGLGGVASESRARAGAYPAEGPQLEAQRPPRAERTLGAGVASLPARGGGGEDPPTQGAGGAALDTRLCPDPLRGGRWKLAFI